MPYGKQEDFNNPTLEDFEQKATPQEKKLWESYLKDYPEKFQRSILAGSDGFLFVCPTANLVVELEKFRRFSDSAGGVSGKKGDALREMGLKAAAYTYRELDTDFDLKSPRLSISLSTSTVFFKEGMVVVNSADNATTLTSGLAFTVSMNFSDGTSTPKSITSKPELSSIIPTRFFPISWRSPATVPRMSFPAAPTESPAK